MRRKFSQSVSFLQWKVLCQVICQTKPVKIKEAWELIDLDALPDPAEVDGVDGLLDEGHVVPDEPRHDHFCCAFRAKNSLQQ